MESQKTLILVALVAVFLRQCDASKADLEKKYCSTAKDKHLCAQMVAGAHNLREASEKAITAAMQYAKKVESMSKSAAKSVKGIPPQTKSSIVDTCKESFENAVDDLKLSLDALKSQDNGTLMTRLSAALASDCEDAFNEFGVQVPMEKALTRYNAELDSTLAVVTQK